MTDVQNPETENEADVEDDGRLNLLNFMIQIKMMFESEIQLLKKKERDMIMWLEYDNDNMIGMCVVIMLLQFQISGWLNYIVN